MAGLIAALMGRKAPKTPWDPALAGLGGDKQGPGPAGQSGRPGTTSATRTFKGVSPRDVKLESDTNVGFDQGFDGVQWRQGGRPYAEGWENPRDTPEQPTPRPRTIAVLRQSPAEWYGGLPMYSDQVPQRVDTVGGNPLSIAQAYGGHSTYDTETPRTQRQPDISGNVPGSNNVRNTIALRWQNPPGIMHTYKSAPRPDQNPKVDGESGAGGGAWSWTDLVTVISRYKWAGTSGGVQTWSVERQMPYGAGRGDGARGADLNGTRYYAEGPPINVNGGQGSYGIARLRGPNHRPVFFTEPAPWTAQFYDTTADVGTADAPGPNTQVPNLVYTSPTVNASPPSTGRIG
jgi:hypothetical protein